MHCVICLHLCYCVTSWSQAASQPTNNQSSYDTIEQLKHFLNHAPEIKYMFDHLITFSNVKPISKILHNRAPQVLHDLVVPLTFTLSDRWSIQSLRRPDVNSFGQTAFSVSGNQHVEFLTCRTQTGSWLGSETVFKKGSFMLSWMIWCFLVTYCIIVCVLYCLYFLVEVWVLCSLLLCSALSFAYLFSSFMHFQCKLAQAMNGVVCAWMHATYLSLYK